MNAVVKNITRRKFLGHTAGIVVAASFPQHALAGVKSIDAVRGLSLHNLHTEEKVSLSYFEQGAYVTEALQDINYLLRDHRTGDVSVIDPLLMDLLYDLKIALGTERPFQVISGYRSPKTNAALHGKSKGVASKSLHMQGKAIDIRVSGIAAETIHAAALGLARGGVGLYTRSNFVHVDTGRVRSW